MRFKMKKWQKAVIWSSTAVLASTAVVVPTTTLTSRSCSRNKKYIDDMDREYNVSSVTYSNMKKEFRTLYEINLDKELPSKEEKQAKLEDFDEKIKGFDKELKESNDSGEKHVNYVSLTTALTKTALDDYDIQLKRESTATWQDLRDQYDGFRDSNEIYMRNLRMSEENIARVLKSADDRFSKIMVEVQSTYRNDPLSGLMNGMPKLLTCFEDTNLDIAALSACERLKDFLGKYTFVFKDDYPGDGNRYDVLRPELLTCLNKPIKDDLMNKMFYCVEAKTGHKINFKADETIPMCRISPILHSLNENEYTNTYTISIDWSLVDTKYIGTDNEKLATGHLYDDFHVTQEEAETKSIAEIITSGNHECMEYNLYASKTYEELQLEKAYFNPKSSKGSIHFKWNDDAKSPDNKYEMFFTGIEKGSNTGILSLDPLAKSGLLISSNDDYYRNVNEVVKENNLNPDVDDEFLPLERVFLRHCEVSSEVKIVNPKTHEVTNKFNVRYVNSVNPTAVYTKIPTFHNDGYLVSHEFFEQANKAYCFAERYIYNYGQNSFKKAKRGVDDLITSYVVAIACGVAWDAYYIFRLLIPIANVEKAGIAQVACLTILEIVIWTAWATFQGVVLFKPLKEMSDNCEKLMKTASFKEINDKIKADEVYFCTPNKKGKFDEEKKEQRYQKFASADFEEVCLPLYQYYCNFKHQDVVIEFAALTKKYDVYPEKASEILDPWLIFGTFYTASVVQAGLSWFVAKMFGPTLVDPTLKGWASIKAKVLQVAQQQGITWSVWGLAYIIRWVAFGIFPIEEDGVIWNWIYG